MFRDELKNYQIYKKIKNKITKENVITDLVHSPHWIQKAIEVQDKCLKKGDPFQYMNIVLHPFCKNYDIASKLILK